MKALNRIRVIIFAIMVLGAFADFAQNEWGNDLIIICEFLIAVSFLINAMSYIVQKMMQKNRKVVNLLELSFGILPAVIFTIISRTKGDSIIETIISILLLLIFNLFLVLIIELIYSFIKKRDKKFFGGFLETYFLAMFFYGKGMGNLHLFGWPGVVMLSGVVLLFFYVFSGIRFFRNSYKHGKLIVAILTLGSFSAILSGLSILFKILHLTGGNVMLYSGFAFAAIVLLFFIKRIFLYNNEPITARQSLKLVNTHIVLIYFLTLVFCSYELLESSHIAPKFYSEQYPVAIYRANNMSAIESAKRTSDIVDTYNAFIERSEKNGFLK